MQFDLKTALKGAPVRLRNGSKAVVFFDMTSVGDKPLTDYPLRGYIVKPKGIDPSCWTKEGRFGYQGPDDSYDIVEMWEDDPNDILATAYNQNKRVFVDNYTYPCDVIGKHKNGSWLLEAEGHIFQLDKNVKVYFTDTSKSEDVRTTLPSPIKITGTQRVWFIRSGTMSHQLVVDCKTAQPSEAFIEQGNCFKSKKDALAWINALTTLAGNE